MTKWIVSFCVLAVGHLFAQSQVNGPVFELRRVVINIEPGSIVGYTGESELGEEIYENVFSFLFSKQFIYNNFFTEDEIGIAIEKNLYSQGVQVTGINNIFTELRPTKKSDYSIALIIDSLGINSDFGGVPVKHKSFHSYIYVRAEVLNLKNNQLEIKKSIKSEFFSKKRVTYKEMDYSYYFSKAWTKLVTDFLSLPEFKEILKTSTNSLTSGNLSEKITLVKPFRKEQSLNIKRAQESVVTVVAGGKSGSGVIVSENGLVLTCFHNLAGVENLEVILSNSVKLKAKVLRSVADFDIALLQIEGATTVPLPLGKSSVVAVGEDVWAIGTPGFTELGQTVTKGIISGERTIDEKNYLQTDASVSPGNSGGPLINSKGEVVGIVNAKVIAKGMEGLGFSIPVSVALEKLNISVQE